MKNLKKTAAVLAAVSTIGATAIAEEGIMLISANPGITVNGDLLENATSITYEGKTMLPLRAICEKLGFEVLWNDEARRIELRNLPVYITLKPGEDAYTFSKTAPMTLGTAPIIAENRTYVPTNFIDEILGGEYSDENGIAITYGEAVEETNDANEAVSVYIKEKTEEGLLVEDFERGEIRLAVSDETVIKDADGNPLTAEELTEGDELLVKYSEVMTMSLPALTGALEITRTGDAAKTVFEGTVKELTADEENDKSVQITIDVDGREFVLNIDENVNVKDLEGNDVAIDENLVGKTVRARTTGISTRSIPPQYPTTDIIVF